MSPQQQAPSPDQDPLFAPSVPEAVADSEKTEVKAHQVDVPVAMANLKMAIKQLGGANEAAGAIFAAEQPEESFAYQELVESVGGVGNLESVYSFLKGNDKSAETRRREWAAAAYMNAVRFWTGVDVPKDDLTLQVGLARFRRLYGAVGKEAQATRRRANVKLERGIKNNGQNIPIEVFYDPSVKVYASSLVKEGRRPWSEISQDIGLSTAEADPADLPILAQVLEFVDAAHEPILTRAEMKQQGLLTEESLRGAYYGASNAKRKKVLEAETAGKQLSEFELRKAQKLADRLAEEKGKEAEKSAYEGRSSRAKRHIEQLKGQMFLIERLRWTIRQEEGVPFELTSKDIEAIRGQIIPDYAEAMVQHTGLDKDQEGLLAEEVTRAVFSPDKILADSVTDRLMWSIQERKSAIERQVTSFAKVPRHIGKSSVAAVVKRP